MSPKRCQRKHSAPWHRVTGTSGGVASGALAPPAPSHPAWASGSLGRHAAAGLGGARPCARASRADGRTRPPAWPQHGPRWALGPQRPLALPPAGRGAVAGRGLFVPTPSANPQCPRPEHTAASTPGALRRSQDADVEGLGCSGVGAPGHRAPRCSAAPPSRPLPRARTSCPQPRVRPGVCAAATRRRARFRVSSAVALPCHARF